MLSVLTVISVCSLGRNFPGNHVALCSRVYFGHPLFTELTSHSVSELSFIVAMYMPSSLSQLFCSMLCSLGFPAHLGFKRQTLSKWFFPPTFVALSAMPVVGYICCCVCQLPTLKFSSVAQWFWPVFVSSVYLNFVGCVGCL